MCPTGFWLSPRVWRLAPCTCVTIHLAWMPFSSATESFFTWRSLFEDHPIQPRNFTAEAYQKSYRATKGSRIVYQPSILRGYIVEVQGCNDRTGLVKLVNGMCFSFRNSPVNIAGGKTRFQDGWIKFNLDLWHRINDDYDHSVCFNTQDV